MKKIDLRVFIVCKKSYRHGYEQSEEIVRFDRRELRNKYFESLRNEYSNRGDLEMIQSTERSFRMSDGGKWEYSYCIDWEKITIYEEIPDESEVSL